MQGERFMEKTETIEIDLATYPRDLLEALIVHSCEQNLPVNTIIVNALTEMVTRVSELSTTK